MYRLTLKNRAFGKFDEETKRYEKYDAEQRFECETLQQLTGLLEFMVATSEDQLELTICRSEDDND